MLNYSDYMHSLHLLNHELNLLIVKKQCKRRMNHTINHQNKNHL